MSISPDLLLSSEKIQELVFSKNEEAYLNVFTFKDNSLQSVINKHIGYSYSITPICRDIELKVKDIYNKYLYPLTFKPVFDFELNTGGFMGILPQHNKQLEIKIDKIKIICSEVRINKEEMVLIKPVVLTGFDILNSIILDKTKKTDEIISLTTNQIKQLIESTWHKIYWSLAEKYNGKMSARDLVEMTKQLYDKESNSKYLFRGSSVNIYNQLFSNPYLTNNLNKEEYDFFIERNKGSEIIDLNINIGIDTFSITYSIIGKTFIEEAASVNYYWDESVYNIYTASKIFVDIHKFITFLAELIKNNNMYIVGDDYLSLNGSYLIKMVLPEKTEINKYSNRHIIRKEYPPNTLPDELYLENTVKYIASVLNGDCFHSCKTTVIENSRHSL